MLSGAEPHQITLNSVLIGNRIREARREKKITQEELSERCSCTATHISNIENGKIGISLELLYKISIILERSLDYFVMDQMEAKPQVKINSVIAPKLTLCDSKMLDVVEALLDKLIIYRDEMEGNFTEKKE